MHVRKYGALGVLALLLLAALYGVIATRPNTRATSARPRAARSGALVVDETSLQTIESLLHLPTAPEEREPAESALRLADQANDLAFAQAVWRLAARPPATTAEAKRINARLEDASRSLVADKANVARITASIAKTGTGDAAAAAKLQDQLEFAKAMTTLDQDEVDDAQQDLVNAGGNPGSGFDDMIQQHEAASKASDTLHVVVTALVAKPGLLAELSAWQSLRDKRVALIAADSAADSTAAALHQRHDSTEARAARRLQGTNASGLTHDSTAALVAEAQRQVLREKSLSTLDRRADTYEHLADALGGWAAVVRAQEATALNRIFTSVAWLLAIALVGALLVRWTEHATSSLPVDLRRRHTLRMVGRVVIQVAAILLILLVLFGPPTNLGTFLGLAGAGLTVALSDFIVAILGWFVLMGRDGIRPGDLVEINDVTGEVVELGIFQTVLLETGDWAGSGHPTGRRVTFSNSFAIQGHYFNFSTTGQWLWDELQIVVPDGRDPYPLADSLRAEVDGATAESAQQAEAEWKGARRAPQFATLAATPTVNVRPVSGGAEVSVRYVTRMSERAALRARLYRTAMELLGTAAAPGASPAAG